MTGVTYTARDDWQHAWQPMIDAVGTNFGATWRVTGLNPVELGLIRNYCEPLEFDCPLHYDAAVAKRHGYRDVLAPHSGTLYTWPSPGWWKPGDSTLFPDASPHAHPAYRGAGVAGDVEAPFPPTTAGFATDIDIEYLEPICVGDRLTLAGRRLRSVQPRETRVGRGAFVKWERTIHNQRDQLVARVLNGSYRYVPHPAAAASDAATTAAGGAASQQAPTDHVGDAVNGAVDWSQQLYHEDVREGDAIPPLVFPLSVLRLVMAAGSNRDLMPMHHDAVVARSQGASDMYANNTLIQGMWERAVREYIGLAGRFRRTSRLRMKIFMTVGETVVTRGSVSRKWVESGEHLVAIEVFSEHSKGIAAGPGEVVVTLPSRQLRR